MKTIRKSRNTLTFRRRKTIIQGVNAVIDTFRARINSQEQKPTVCFDTFDGVPSDGSATVPDAKQCLRSFLEGEKAFVFILIELNEDEKIRDIVFVNTPQSAENT